MAIIKCKMCGGDLNLMEGVSTAECEYCGSVQTVPKVDDEKKLTLFARANRLRSACEFDKAAGIYESIVADFPEEAEAYWGLVLCKYGIEYVDDPATGKKIPTCHRSSFDSILDDNDLEQALENADPTAQKVYREEAKQFERIRKGILEVSSSEKPYDIFICYKETAENGDRTLDSVLAQDLYGALTDKGYRVFFSRITLQGKLGEAYEPYIFAALNSAKVMLAVGTCYEYYNAVWVKNEWSRYLKICAADKSKHLIPCYKDLDPEDMPREFNHLQGADLGKMGAVQDILFNMEKYIPLKKENTTVIQERVVVGGSGGDNKIASLLDRGNMALEDGEWEKADSFFEDVLNNDSKNAQAYLGKTLSQERCRTIDAFARKRKETYAPKSEALYIGKDLGHIQEMEKKFSLHRYVEPNEISKFYDFDLRYYSKAGAAKQRLRDEEMYWQNHKLLSKAEKFATGAVAESLAKEKNTLLAYFAEQIKKAEAAEAEAKRALQARYEKHLLEADGKAEKRYAEGLARREADFRELADRVAFVDDPEKHCADFSEVTQLQEKASQLDLFGDFKNARELAHKCRDKAEADRQWLRELQREQDRIAAEKWLEEGERRRKIYMIVGFGAAAALVIWLIISHIVNVVIPNNKYKEAQRLFEDGKYDQAITMSEDLGDFKNSEGMVETVKLEKLNAELYAERKAQYQIAEKLEAEGKTMEAAIAFGKAAGFEDATERSYKLWNTRKLQTFAAGHAHVVALQENGKVVASGVTDDGRIEVSEWENVVKVAAVNGQTFGLKIDGTVLSTGYNKYKQCDVSHWANIVDVVAGKFHTVGIKVDGTVVAVGCDEDNQCSVSAWKDIVAVSVSDHHTVGLKEDGTVVATGSNASGQCDLDSWSDIVAICATNGYTVGLKSDGTVVAAGNNDLGQCVVTHWTDIVAISASSGQTVGLKSDGDVVAAGNNDNGQCNLTDWTGIAEISSQNGHVVGLKSDGTVVAKGFNDSKQCETTDWKNIVGVYPAMFGTLGLQKDGKLVAVGDFMLEKCDLSVFTDIKIP